MKNIFSLLALIVCFALNSQVKEEVFESFKLQEKRDVKYYIPEDYDEKTKYPLIIVFDAEYLFDQVVAISQFYSNFHGMPKMIVAGINQNEDSIRLDDCAWSEEDGLPDDHSKRFFEFVGMEFIPYLEESYNTAPFKMIIGYDITANFQNYWLFKENSLFNAYVNISPTLAPEMETRVPTRMAAMDQKIFYQLILEGEKNRYTSRIKAMDKSIQEIKKESLRYYFNTHESADHISIATYGIGQAFDNIFGMFKPISPKEYKTKLLTSELSVFDYLDNKYKTIEDLFGITKTVDLNDIMAVYAGSRKKEDFQSLLPLSELCKTVFPESMLGFYFEGEHYEQAGDPKKALKSFEKAFIMDEIDFLTKEMALDKIDAIKEDFGF